MLNARRLLCVRGLWLALSIWPVHAAGQAGPLVSPPAAEGDHPGAADAQSPARVDVRPGADDEAIATRLRRILRATGWFREPEARARDGVVLLAGLAESEQKKKWAEEVARNTEDVVAVVNQMTVRELPLWNLTPALVGLQTLVRSMILALPGFGLALVVLMVTFLMSKLVRLGIQSLLRRRIQNRLLRRVLARTVGIGVLLLGVYVVLYVSGLTRLAVSVLGGTGLVGLVLGIAFRDISENFLASVFLSVQRPFRVDDLIEVAGTTGFVQRTTFRTTVLLTLDGNQVQVPNATIYKSVIRNFSSTPSRREDFVLGIGMEVPITSAQSIALRVLQQHPAVLSEPEPWVLVDAVGSATVNLRVYFWLDGTRHSWLKVRSSVIRLIKRAFQDAKIAMPDEAREVIFPEGLPIRMLTAVAQHPPRPDDREPEGDSADPVSAGEGSMSSDVATLKQQAAREHVLDSENLLGADGTAKRTQPGASS